MRCAKPAYGVQTLQPQFKRGLQRPCPLVPRASSGVLTPETAIAIGRDLGVYQFCKSHDHVVTAGADAPPLVILPGFGNKATDYCAPFGRADVSLAAALRRRGFRPYVLPIESRKQWFSVGRALFTRAYWSGECTIHQGYSWYLKMLAELVDSARLETGSDQVDLVGHSAGGWLGRAFIGGCVADGLAEEGGEPHPAVRSLITLGTPHSAPPPEAGVKDVTGGALPWVNGCWPGAHFAQSGVRYVAVAGRTVRGSAKADRRTLRGYANSSYTQVCGMGHGLEGDAVVPLKSALLEGAEHVVVPGVYHSMSRIQTFNEPSGQVWYGSDDVVDLWLQHL